MPDISSLYGHNDRIYDCAFLSGVFITVGEGGSCIFWDMDTREELTRAHTGALLKSTLPRINGTAVL